MAFYVADIHSNRVAQAIVDDLTLLFGSTYTVSLSYDATSGYPIVTVVTGSGNNSVRAIVYITPAIAPASGAYDSLGLNQVVYTPHIVSVLFDTTASVGTTAKEQLYVLKETLALGSHLDLYNKAEGAGNIARSDITSQGGTNWIASVDNIDLRNGTLSNL